MDAPAPEGSPSDADPPDTVDAFAPTDASDAADAVGPPPDYCAEIPPLAEAPVIDGVIDPGLALREVLPTAWWGSGNEPPGHSLRYAVAWRPEGLYFFLRAGDPDRNPADPAEFVWRGDSVEIYVDGDGVFPPPPTYDNPGAAQLIYEAPADDATPGTRAEGYRESVMFLTLDTTKYVSVPTAEGYDVEAFVTGVALSDPGWTLSAGSFVGFDLAHNASVAPGEIGYEGNRDAQYFLRVREPLEGNPQDFPFANTTVFCPATLLP